MGQNAQAPQRRSALTALPAAWFRRIREVRLEAAHELVERLYGEHRERILTSWRGDVGFRHVPTV